MTTARGSLPSARSGATDSRRDRILSAAATLFRERGFHGAGIDDIGAAAGIAGPSVYRHFASKHELLVAVFDAVLDHLLAGATDIVAHAGSPTAALEELVDFHLDFTLDDARLIVVYEQEERNLDDPDRHRIRRRQRSYVEEWMEPLALLLPDVSPVELRTRVQAAIGLVHSVAHARVSMPRRELHTVIRAMAMAGLLART